MRRLIWLPIAGFLLVAGAAIAAAAAGPSVTPVAQSNQGAASAAPSAAASPQTNDQNPANGPGDHGFGYGMGKGFGMTGDGLLNQVLSDLVKAGTITQDQADAITKALQQAVTDKQATIEQQRQQDVQEWQQIQGFLSDGVITQGEVNQLPADSPFRQVFNSIAQNGQITLQQLQQLRMFGPGMGRPGMMGPGGHRPSDNHDPAPQASPSATGTSS